MCLSTHIHTTEDTATHTMKMRLYLSLFGPRRPKSGPAKLRKLVSFSLLREPAQTNGQNEPATFKHSFAVPASRYIRVSAEMRSGYQTASGGDHVTSRVFSLDRPAPRYSTHPQEGCEIILILIRSKMAAASLCALSPGRVYRCCCLGQMLNCNDKSP